MRLKLEGEWNELENGLRLISWKLGLELVADGLPVRVEKSAGRIEARLLNGQGVIRFKERIHFFRALGLFVEAAQAAQQFEVVEEPQFTMNGVLLDASRNGVMTVDSLKTLLREMAVMGLNVLMLYTEDTYTVESEPYFGYMRGRYTPQELTESAEYAAALGIEIIPCIQTLAHLEQFLKWPRGDRELVDTNGVLLVGSDATYELIEKMIAAASAPLRSRRIHIGMDEALGMGRGRYLDQHGWQDRFDLLTAHLNKVLEITARRGLRPMMWSDMYFRAASQTHDYYDLNAAIPEQVKQNVPPGIQLVYWDYYHEDESFYQEYIRRHKELSPNPIFAGGAWTWNGIGTSYGKVFATTNTALKACKEQGIQEVLLTLWGDDGSENNFFSALLAMQLYAEHGYARTLDIDKLKRRVEFCTGTAFEAFMDLRYLDETPGTLPDNLEHGSPANPSKFLLWQDVLIGLFDRHVEGLDLAAHYAQLETKFRQHQQAASAWASLFDVPEKLCAVLQIKSDIGLRLKIAYDQGDRQALEQIAQEQLPELARRAQALRAAHRAQWFSINKPFGWEVLDIRYGGLLARLDSAAARVCDFLEGRAARIEELEAERLCFDGLQRPQPTVSVGVCNQYTRIVTAGLFSLVWPPI